MNKTIAFPKWGVLGSILVITSMMVVSVVTMVGAFSSGVNGYSGNPATGGNTCNNCHSGGITPTVSLQGPLVVAPGEVATYTLTIAGGQEVSGGLNVSVVSGTLATMPGATDTQLSSGEITHTDPKSVNGDLEVLFAFRWTAPIITGTTTMYAAGNSVNDDSSTTGDRANTAVFNIFVGTLNEKVYLPVIQSQ